MACQQRATRTNEKLRTFHLLLHIKVCKSFDTLRGLLNLKTKRMEHRQVRTEHLDGNSRLCARKHGIDTMGNGLADFHIYARKRTKALADVCHHFLLRTFVEAERYLHLAGVHAKGMFVKLRTACLARHILHFWYLEQQHFCLSADSVAFIKRNTGKRADIDGERTFVEWWKKRTTKGEEQAHSDHNQCTRHAQNPMRWFTAERPL